MFKKFVVRSPPEVVFCPLTKHQETEAGECCRIGDRRAAGLSNGSMDISSSRQQQRRIWETTGHYIKGVAKKIVLWRGSKCCLNDSVNMLKDVCVQVFAAGVNFGDLSMVNRKFQVVLPPPFIPGTEMAGRVLEVADDVSELKHGMRVCGFCRSFGAFAEEVVTQAESLWIIPEEMNFTDAAGFVVSYGTAMLSLKKRANLQPGEHLLVTAAAGGAGLAAVDIGAHVLNAKVIGAVGSTDKCSLVKSYGAIDCINYTNESVHHRTKEISSGGANVVFATVGGKVFNEALRCFASGDIPSIPANELHAKNASAVGFYWTTYAMYDLHSFRWSVEESLKQYKKGKIKPHICKTFNLSQINEAFQYLESRKSTGKVVIIVR